MQVYYMYIKRLLHKKVFYVCNLVIPIVFATVLFVIVKNLGSVDDFHTIPVGIVLEDGNSQEAYVYKAMLEARNKKGEAIFEVNNYTLTEGMEALGEEKIDGCILLQDEIKLYINKNGMNQSIIKSYLEEYEQFRILCTSVDENGETTIDWDTISQILEESTYTQEEKKGLMSDSSMLYFLALIGMCCMLTMELGFSLAEYVLPNQSPLAARLQCTSVRKFQRFWGGLFATLTVALSGFILIMLFLRYVLGYYIPLNHYYVWTIIILGLFSGILFGYVIRGLLKKKGHWKHTISMAVVTITSFLAGIIRIDVKYYMKQNYKVLTYINPVNLVSDGLYQLLFLKSYATFFKDTLILTSFMFLMLIGAQILTGRRTYDYI